MTCTGPALAAGAIAPTAAGDIHPSPSALTHWSPTRLVHLSPPGCHQFFRLTNIQTPQLTAAAFLC